MYIVDISREKPLCWYAAGVITSYHQERFQRTKFITPRSFREQYYLGFLGEMAVGLAFGQFPDFRLYFNGSDQGIDLRIFPGLNVQVKTSMRPGHGFILKPNQRPNFDIGIKCCYVNKTSMGIVGYLTRKDFKKRAIKERSTYSDVWYYPARYLRPIWELGQWFISPRIVGQSKSAPTWDALNPKSK